MRYVIPARLPASTFWELHPRASRLANDHRCLFWWKPHGGDRYDFVFDNEKVGVLFRGVLATEGIPVESIPPSSVNPVSVTAQYLLKGYALALEQCGLLLRDANCLYQNELYATAVALAAFAREELGRSQILLKFWRSHAGGIPVTIEQIDAACTDHVDKQRAGMLSTVMTAHRDSELGKLLNARMNNPPQSQEWKDADAELEKLLELMSKRTPHDRHEKRMSAIYVEPKSETDWNRPADVAVETARKFLQDAANDYSVRCHQGYIPAGEAILKATDRELYDGLEKLANRPILPAPEWPTMPA